MNRASQDPQSESDESDESDHGTKQTNDEPESPLRKLKGDWLEDDSDSGSSKVWHCWKSAKGTARVRRTKSDPAVAHLVQGPTTAPQQRSSLERSTRKGSLKKMRSEPKEAEPKHRWKKKKHVLQVESFPVTHLDQATQKHLSEKVACPFIEMTLPDFQISSRALIDTGSDENFIDQKILRDIMNKDRRTDFEHIKFVPMTTMTIRGIGGQGFDVTHRVLLQVQLSPTGAKRIVSFFRMPKNGPKGIGFILGTKALACLRLRIDFSDCFNDLNQHQAGARPRPHVEHVDAQGLPSPLHVQKHSEFESSCEGEARSGMSVAERTRSPVVVEDMLPDIEPPVWVDELSKNFWGPPRAQLE